MAGLHQGHALIILEPTEAGRNIEGWGKSAVFPHPLDAITLLPAITFHRSVQDNPWKHLCQVQHWFHTSWLDFPHLEHHLRLAARLAPLRLVRDLSKVFSLFILSSINEKGQWLFPFGVAQSLTFLSGVSSKSKPFAIYLDLACWSSVAGASLMSSIQSWEAVCRCTWTPLKSGQASKCVNSSMRLHFQWFQGTWQIYPVPALTHC